MSVDSYYTTLIQVNGISVPAKTFGTRDIPVGIAGGLNNADYIYGMLSNNYAELENISLNEGQIVQSIRDLELMVISRMDHIPWVR